MPIEYQLKKPAIDMNRLQKEGKIILQETKENRQLAKDAYEYYKGISEDEEATALERNKAAELRVEFLKLMQSAHTTSIKLLDLLEKIGAKMDDVGGKSAMSTLPTHRNLSQLAEIE